MECYKWQARIIPKIIKLRRICHDYLEKESDRKQTRVCPNKRVYNEFDFENNELFTMLVFVIRTYSIRTSNLRMIFCSNLVVIGQ